MGSTPCHQLAKKILLEEKM